MQTEEYPNAATYNFFLEQIEKNLTKAQEALYKGDTQRTMMQLNEIWNTIHELQQLSQEFNEQKMQKFDEEYLKSFNLMPKVYIGNRDPLKGNA